MAKRMQILIDEAEYRRIQRLARRQGMSLAEWVRRALRAAYREQPLGDRDKRLAAVRASSAGEFPTADIEQMLEQIAQGYQHTDSV